MLGLLLVAAVWPAVCSEYSARCSPDSNTSLSLRPSTDSEVGRYVLEYCTKASDVHKWVAGLQLVDEPPERCNSLLGDLHSGPRHSRSDEQVNLQLNCSHVCLSKSLDLVFRHCYYLHSQLETRPYYLEEHHAYYFADNNITADYYLESAHLVKDFSNGMDVSFHWYTGRIPVTTYTIEVCTANKTAEQVATFGDDECADAGRNCSRSPDAHAHALRCTLRLPRGRYYMQLKHTAPWTVYRPFSEHVNLHGRFCHEEPECSPPLSVAAGAVPRAVWAWGACAVALAAGALAALLAWDTRLARKVRRRVMDSWLLSATGADSVSDDADAKPADAEAGAGAADPPRVLLLYARECAAAERVVAALRELLELVAPGNVYDIYSPEVTALAGCAAGAWLRALVQQPACRVLLVQSPALRCLHRARLRPHDAQPTLEAPLLPERVLYRLPVFGDTLLQYALRLMADAAHGDDARPYHKYYIATLSELPAEAFPTVVPYRRYELPVDAAALLRDLSPAAPAPAPAPAPTTEQLAALAAAATEFAQYVRDKPDYLMDELMFL